MTEKEINEQYEQICDLLKASRLKEAMTQLDAYLQSCNAYRLRTKLEEVQMSYQYMLQYMRQGVDDAERTGLYRKLVVMVWMLADQTHLRLLDEVSPSYYHTSRKVEQSVPPLHEWLDLVQQFPDDLAVCKLMPANENSLNEILNKHEKAQRQAFLTIWRNSMWTPADVTALSDAYKSELIPVNDLCLFVSAITLSLMQCFDPLKFAFLLDVRSHQNVHISQRAMVGMVLVILTHPEQMQLYPEFLLGLSLEAEETGLSKHINSIYIQLLRAQETEQIDKKMREEIIPEMMRNVNLMRNMKLGIDEMPEDEEQNPDWEKAMEEKLGDKIREMGELQQEGADVYMSTFAQLKGFPFFRELPNWFYPFDVNHSAVISQFGLDAKPEKSALSLILHSGFFCNSDKYSLCFIMNQVPEEQRGQLFDQLTAQGMDELKDDQRMLDFKKYAERPEVVSNLYIQDLYRFFKLYPRRHEFRNPFASRIALHELPCMQQMLAAPELQKTVADFHFKKEHYQEAQKLYERVADLLPEAEMFQKLAYCCQKQKLYEKAVTYYHKADLLKPDHIWTIRRLATCYRQLRNYDAALEYYQKAEEIQPENYNLLFYTAACLAEMEQYDAALKYLYKLDYLNADNPKTWRALAWCSFQTRAYDQAMKYYEKLLVEKPVAADFLNAAHVSWAKGLVAEAAELYTQAAQRCESHDAFLALFDKDIETLQKHGISEADIPLMKDLTL